MFLHLWLIVQSLELGLGLALSFSTNLCDINAHHKKCGYKFDAPAVKNKTWWLAIRDGLLAADEVVSCRAAGVSEAIKRLRGVRSPAAETPAETRS